MNPKSLPAERLESTFFPLQGGTDLITPQLVMEPGATVEAVNFEIPSEGGYRRIYGYERFDGRPSPSTASVTVLASDTPLAVTQANLGNTVVGQTSAATGIIIYVDSGLRFIAVVKVTGAFTATGEVLKIGAATIGTSNSGALPSYYTGLTTNAINAAAANNLRADIGVVPGTGPVLGVWVYNSVVYAFRNNAGGTAAVMHKRSAAGWVDVTLPLEVKYTAGNNALGTLQASTEAGGTGILTQGGVTATVRRITLESGSFLGGTAAGRLIITGVAGGNFAAGAATATGGAAMTLGGVQTQIVLAPNGRYEFQNFAFTGLSSSFRMYGCDGKNRAFEFDGTNYVPVTTGMANDTPSFLRVHLHMLFLTFDASVQFSSPGNPFAWTPILGAGEFALGATCTGLIRGLGNEVTGGLILFTKDITYALYGTSTGTFELQPVAPESGARAYTSQNLIAPVYLDKLGITNLTQTQAYGRYEQSVISEKVKRYVNDRLDIATCSTVIRKDNQYRIYFSDGTAIAMTFKSGEVDGSMLLVQPDVFNCACESSDLGGVQFAGALTSGYVYQLNAGRSFDGVAIGAYFRLAFNHCKSPMMLKYFRRATTDLYMLGPGQIAVNWNLSTNNGIVDNSSQAQLSISPDQSNWDVSNWDTFVWDSDPFTRQTFNIGADASDISLIVQASSDSMLPFTVQGVILEFSKRRQRRDYY